MTGSGGRGGVMRSGGGGKERGQGWRELAMHDKPRCDKEPRPLPHDEKRGQGRRARGDRRDAVHGGTLRRSGAEEMGVSVMRDVAGAKRMYGGGRSSDT
ncbi:hypothetical protein U9M48_022638 [Paspalum notatum var. saurae]|uniref:Uncharacterized protein n=1 Tax=Paspalum notatum var. saurae TaxID=547442 RepID=A0AAQ3TI43_PASNO